MSFSAGGSAPGDRREPVEQEESQSAAVPDPALLEQVLEETLSGHALWQLEPVELQALANVAQRYPGAALVVDPVAVELVKSILKARFRALNASEVLWHDVSCQIATALCEAPDTRARLERLWSQLSGLVT